MNLSVDGKHIDANAKQNFPQNTVLEQKKKLFFWRCLTPSKMPNIVNILKKVLPAWLYLFIRSAWRFYSNCKLKAKISIVQKSHKRALERFKTKTRFTVAFFVIHDSVWKYDRVYNLMLNNLSFEPIIIVCPYVSFGRDNMLIEMNKTYETFKLRGYNVVKTYDDSNDSWLNVKKTINPDIVFFSNPHNLTRPEYYIHNWLDHLTCYVQYSFHITHLNELQYNQEFHNLLWLAFYETSIHQTLARKYAINKAKNVVISGYPGIDYFFDRSYKPNDCWKIKDRSVKRIIWAPHHTIEGEGSLLDYSNFLKYYKFMIEVAQKFSGQIQIAFKPHPLLFNKLCAHPDWGKNKTDEYYGYWKNLINGQLNDSDYVDLFLTSDALIHDCASFMTEYLCVNKPVLFTARNGKIVNRFNEFGNMSYSFNYHGFSEEDIVNFIQSVISGKDPMMDARKAFVMKFLMPPNGVTASENIVSSIESYLSLQ